MKRDRSATEGGKEGRRSGGIEELTVKGHGSSDAGDPDTRRNGDDWSGGEAGLPRDENVGVATGKATGKATERATGRAKSSRT